MSESLFSGIPGNFVLTGTQHDFQNRAEGWRLHLGYALARTRRMFRYTGLPDTIPERELEIALQMNGTVAWFRVPNDAVKTDYRGKLYAIAGRWGVDPDPYYIPTTYLIADPYLWTGSLKIGEDAIIMKNDSMMMGLLPIHNRMSSQLAQSELTLWCIDILSRVKNAIAAGDTRTKRSAEEYLAQIEEGNLAGVIADNAFLETLKTVPMGDAKQGDFQEHIELIQYIKGSWENEIGLEAMFDMKREAINSGEAQLGNHSRLVLAEDMLLCRREALDQINEMFGTAISVDFATGWKDEQKENDLELDNIENDLEGGDADDQREIEDTPRSE